MSRARAVVPTLLLAMAACASVATEVNSAAVEAPDPRRDEPPGDRCLFTLHSDPAAAAASTGTTPTPRDIVAVRLELAIMVAVDQSARNAAFGGNWLGEEKRPLMLAYRAALGGGKMDPMHTARLKELLDRWGWIKSSVFGPDASNHAWLLTQHADLDRDFQQRVLDLMEANLATGDASPTDFAYLTDRILIAKEKPQRYGTQGECIAVGEWVPAPMEDPDQIDARRASVGLGTLADYQKVFKDSCAEPDPPSDGGKE